ncbi:putative cytochrome p450 protein [Neofusicoccum parvum UCRNP2]|uniref:Putative cytochrome p450 protein n=1 Tax=Botryosphaeria parva (strain UCR-NP2) TaxID=1287680 RepID=R1GG98_BOTPV|nr:putative cytochrome p450 protein [Neofusicoccum parvum UCRNP2]
METTTSQQAFRFGPYVALSGLFFTLAAYLIHRIPAVHPHLQYTAWAARYGPLYTIMKGNTPYLIISSAPLAHELLNKRGQLTAGRPAHRLDLEGRGNYVPAMMSGPRWRAARKMWHSILNVGAARCYLPYQTLEASKLLVDVADDPARLRRHLERFSNKIDRVVGPDRLPRDEDAVDLPYTRQVIQELQRWISVAPLALPHATTAPMQVGEWHIPAGTVLVLNTYAIHTDPATYPEPREFRPERWEGKLEMVTSDEQVGARTDLFAFGAGRRVCPGQHLAERNLFFMVSYMLWAFDIKKQKDDGGREIDIDMDDLRPGIVNTINPYSVDVKPRSAGRLELVKANWAEQREKLLDANEQWIQSPEAVTSVMAKTAK